MAEKKLTNETAEKSVLGAVLNSTVSIDDLGRIGPDSFAVQQYQQIYKIACDLHAKGKTPDLVAVSEHFGNVNVLSDLVGSVFAGSVNEHIETVADLATRRALQQKAAELHGLAEDKTQDASAILDKAQHDLNSLSNLASDDAASVSDVMHSIFNQLEQGTSNEGVTTGFYMLDLLTCGLQPTNLIIVAARPGMGKTAFASNLMVNISANGYPVGMFSLEMAREQIVKRMLSQVGKINAGEIKAGQIKAETWTRLYETAERIYKLPIFIDDTTSPTIYDLRSKARKMQKKHGIKVLVIDYLTKIKPSTKRSTRDQEVTDIATDLKSLARELRIPVVCLAQLNRDVEKRSNKRPTLADLRESGGIEQEADDILFLYREAAYKPNCGHNQAEAIIAKQRNGELGNVKMAWVGEYVSFEELAYEQGH